MALYRKTALLSTKTHGTFHHFPLHFLPCPAYTVRSDAWKGGTLMRETNDPFADLDDLIFDEDDGGPSER